MRTGYSPRLKQLVRAADSEARLFVFLEHTHQEDVRRRQDQFDDAATLTDVETFDYGAVTLLGTPGVKIQYTSGSDYISNISGTRPRPGLLWQIDKAIAADAELRAIDIKLTRRRVGANDPYDGIFVVTAWAVDVGSSVGTDVWGARRLADSLPFRAPAMATDEEFVSFAFTSGGLFSSKPAPIRLNASLVPSRLVSALVTGADALGFEAASQRCVLFTIAAVGGTNTNYGIVSDAAAATEQTTAGAGTLYHRELQGGSNDPNKHLVAAGTGMWQIKLSTATYEATGSIEFDDIVTPASPAGDVELVLKKNASGGTLTAYASDDGGATSVAFVDGDLAADLGLGQINWIKVEMAANAAADASPTLFEVGIRDRTRHDVTERAALEGGDTDCDPESGRYKMAEAMLKIGRTGERDFRGIERFLADNNLADIQVRTFIALSSTYVDREEWLELDLWDVDDYELTPAGATLTLVSIANRLKGKFPAADTPKLGYLLKATDSDLTGGADFTKELSEVEEAADSLSPSVALSATEENYAFTKAGVPNLLAWPAGGFTVAVKVTAGHASIFGSVRIARVNAAGAVQEETADSPEQQLTAAQTYTFNLRNLEWAAGAATDRLLVVLILRNADSGGAHAVTIETGTSGTQVVAPWMATGETVPISYGTTLDTLAEVWPDVLEQIALQDRFKGAPPADATNKIGKELIDFDGQRELERLAALDGGGLGVWQGRINFVSLAKARGVAAFVLPLEHQKDPRSTLGYTARTPRYVVPYNWDGAKFVDVAITEHADALEAFGVSRVTKPSLELERETAQWIRGPRMAFEIADTKVMSGALGQMRHETTPTIRYPEATEGDLVAAETEDLAFKDPVTGESIRGRVWVFGPIIGFRGHWPFRRWVIWPRGMVDLLALDHSVERRTPYEAVKVVAYDKSPAGKIGNARILFRTSPAGATVYYRYTDGDAAAPDPANLDLWTAWDDGDGDVLLARDQSLAKKLWYYGVLGLHRGAMDSLAIPADATATIGTLLGSQSGSDPTVIAYATAGEVDADTRVIEYYARVHATSWPTDDAASTGRPDPAYLLYRLPVNPNLPGEDIVAGTAIAGGLRALQMATGRSTGDKVKVIAVPLDYNFNEGTRKTLDYTVAAAATPTYSAASVVSNVTTDELERTVDVSLTPDGTNPPSDVTHDVRVKVRIDGGSWATHYTATNANSAPGDTNRGIGVINNSAGPIHTADFMWELIPSGGGTVIASGYIGFIDFRGVF